MTVSHLPRTTLIGTLIVHYCCFELKYIRSKSYRLNKIFGIFKFVDREYGDDNSAASSPSSSFYGDPFSGINNLRLSRMVKIKAKKNKKSQAKLGIFTFTFYVSYDTGPEHILPFC